MQTFKGNPNFIDFYDFYKNEDYVYYIVMERNYGCSLTNLMDKLSSDVKINE